MAKPTVHVDIEADSPFVKTLQKSFPQFEVVAEQVTPNDHANARAFSHLASKLIELEVDKKATILDIGSAPARRMYSEHTYHCVCPMKTAEDPDRIMGYARKLKEKCLEITDRNLAAKLKDLKDVMARPDEESPSFCLHTDSTCRTCGDVAVYQDVYAVHAPTSIYHQAVKGVRTVYWIGFDTTPFMFPTLAGSYPSYATNWADETVLQARNIGLCANGLTEGGRKGLSILRKKALRPSGKILFSVGSTLYTENREMLRSWHLPSVFHLKGKKSFTARCDTIVSCEGYVVKKISLCPGLYGRPSGYAVTYHSEGFLISKVTDTIRGERVSFPVCTYVPATLCDQMTGILATEVSPDDAQKLLVGLNQRIVVNGRTQRNTNTMKNYLLPVVALAFSKWAKEYRADLEDEKLLGVRERELTCCCMWTFKIRKSHTMYKKPETQTIVKVVSEYSSFLFKSPWTEGLSIGLCTKIKLMLDNVKPRKTVTITESDVKEAQDRQQEAHEEREAELDREALPALQPTAPPVEQIQVDFEDLERAGAGVVETPRRAVRVTAQAGDTMIGEYLLVSPQTVLRSAKLECVHELAEQVKIMTHSGRSGRYPVEGYDGRVLLPAGTALEIPDFQALSESATMVYNEREFVNRKLKHIALHGASLNTDEENYDHVDAEAVDHEYVFDVDKGMCVKRDQTSGLVLVGDLTNPPYHEFAYEGLRIRPSAVHKVPIIGVFGVPGSGKSAIIKSLVNTRDLVTSGKKENCTEIVNDVKKQRNMTIIAKTVDSILLNGCRSRPETLYVDEAFACHAGTLLALISIVKPSKKVVLCGDPKQCGFFNMMQLKVNYNHDICTQVFHKSISRRCTQPITAIVSTLHYGGKMRTTNPCTRPVEIDITGKTKPQKGDLILTCFRGWVKQLEIDYRGHEVMTAAASQGLTRKGVYAVRQKVNMNPLYAEKSEHVNVLLTRTEDRLVWKTSSGDPWISVLTNVPPGNFSATIEEWEAEHNAIVSVLEGAHAPIDVFACKSRVCWAKALQPVLDTAGIQMTADQWSELLPPFKEDQAYSPEVALNAISTRFYGYDLDSGLFSADTVSLRYTENHWDNEPGGKKYGFDHAVARRLEQRHPYLKNKWKLNQQLLVAEGVAQPVSTTCNVVPVNRRLPHPLVLQHEVLQGKPVEDFLMQFVAQDVAVVAPRRVSMPLRKVTWVSDIKYDGDIRCHLDVGLPAVMGMYDLVAVLEDTTYRGHHYLQCEDHALKMHMLAGDAVKHLRPGGTLVVKCYGYADRFSEMVVCALGRKFRRVRACRPPCVNSNTEMYLVFTHFDNRNRPFTLKTLNETYAQHLPRAGAAPAYRVRRADIANCTEEVVVNAANSRGVIGEGVCGAIGRKWPAAFKGSATPVGTAKLTKSPRPVIHAVGPNFHQVTELEGEQQLRAAYQAVADLVNKENYTSVAIPLLSTGIYAAGKDRLMQSLNHLFTAMDNTDADVTIYCRDKKWERTIADAIRQRETPEALSLTVDEPLDVVRVHPLSSLVGRPGYSKETGKLHSYLEGTKFHQTSMDMAEIYTMFPKVEDANEQICMYVMGETMDQIRQKCPVEDQDSSSPVATVPCLCRLAMTAERVQRLRAVSTKQFAVCSSFPLPKYRIQGVQKVQCGQVLLFSSGTVNHVSPRKYTVVAPRSDSVSVCSVRTPSDACSQASVTFDIICDTPPAARRSMARQTLDEDIESITDTPIIHAPIVESVTEVEVHAPPPEHVIPVSAPRRQTPVPRPRTIFRGRAPEFCPSSALLFGDFAEGEVEHILQRPIAKPRVRITFGDFTAEESEAIRLRSFALPQ
ncbi:non-structural polyprotein ns123 [Ndumu virus]|nr:non-structural polyprotein ns123 [Ndumu virus]AEJ36230.1 non structural polyprotein [Ndumu virus]QQZ00848.1 non-structural polyprotein [Ndumu virus]